MFYKRAANILSTFHVHSFQESVFLGHHQRPRENGWLLKITMVENNGESTPRTMGGDGMVSSLGSPSTCFRDRSMVLGRIVMNALC